MFSLLSQASKQHREKDMAKVEELELRRTMKNLVVPVIDTEVRALLRQLGEPITLFGEDKVRFLVEAKAALHLLCRLQ